MTSKKIILIALACVFNSFLLSAQFLENEYADGEEIPFGLADVEFGLYYSHHTSYSIESRDVSSPSGVVSEPFINKNSGMGLLGVGFNIHSPILYWILNKDESRFRIADDFGIGLYGIHGLGVQAHAGVRSVFRINDFFDVGAQYYPFYAQTDNRPNGARYIGNDIGRSGFGFNGRIGICYIDFSSIKAKNSSNEKYPSRFNNVKLKFLYDDDSEATLNYISLTVGSAAYSNKTENAKYGPVYQEFSDSKNKYLFVHLGWGVTF